MMRISESTGRRRGAVLAAGALAAGMAMLASGTEAAPAPVPRSVELAGVITNTLGCEVVLDFIDV